MVIILMVNGDYMELLKDMLNYKQRRINMGLIEFCVGLVLGVLITCCFVAGKDDK